MRCQTFSSPAVSQVTLDYRKAMGLGADLNPTLSNERRAIGTEHKVPDYEVTSAREVLTVNKPMEASRPGEHPIESTKIDNSSSNQMSATSSSKSW